MAMALTKPVRLPRMTPMTVAAVPVAKPPVAAPPIGKTLRMMSAAQSSPGSRDAHVGRKAACAIPGRPRMSRTGRRASRARRMSSSRSGNPVRMRAYGANGGSSRTRAGRGRGGGAHHAGRRVADSCDRPLHDLSGLLRCLFEQALTFGPSRDHSCRLTDLGVHLLEPGLDLGVVGAGRGNLLDRRTVAAVALDCRGGAIIGGGEVLFTPERAVELLPEFGIPSPRTHFAEHARHAVLVLPGRLLDAGHDGGARPGAEIAHGLDGGAGRGLRGVDQVPLMAELDALLEAGDAFAERRRLGLPGCGAILRPCL